jgi:predicted membrane protein
MIISFILIHFYFKYKQTKLVTHRNGFNETERDRKRQKWFKETEYSENKYILNDKNLYKKKSRST